MKNVLRYTISLVLAGGLIWFVFKDINLSEMLDRFAKSDWRWIAVSCFFLIVCSRNPRLALGNAHGTAGPQAWTRE
jgi:uncharacterized membrane protein YbhN (UPF0104 family)